jgi:hypothetical protein
LLPRLSTVLDDVLVRRSQRFPRFFEC